MVSRPLLVVESDAVAAHPYELDERVSCLFTFVHGIVYFVLCLSLVRWLPSRELSTNGFFLFSAAQVLQQYVKQWCFLTCTANSTYLQRKLM